MFVAVLLAGFDVVSPVAAQSLDEDLRRLPAVELAGLARKEGDAIRGAIVFFQHHMACSKCHLVGDVKPSSLLGPDLTKLSNEATDESLVESVLLPSQAGKVSGTV